MAPLFRAVLPAASVVRLTNAVLPPTAPANVVVPAVFTTRLNAPFTVLPRVMLPAPFEERTVFAVNVTASLYVWAPLVVTAPPPRTVLPAASVVRLTSGVAAPTAPPNVVVPPVFTVSVCAPFTLLASVILPPDV